MRASLESNQRLLAKSTVNEMANDGLWQFTASLGTPIRTLPLAERKGFAAKLTPHDFYITWVTLHVQATISILPPE